MIYIVGHHDFIDTVWEFKRKAEGSELNFIKPLVYQRLFSQRRAPVGHYIFTDFDRLSAYEIQVADRIAERVKQAAPDVRIFNRPARVLERYPLLRRLAEGGLNDFSAYRLDCGEWPKRYPVFIRCEDDCTKPDTGLLQSEIELRAAIEALQARGVPLKRRIAVEVCAKPDGDGIYRKYGVFKIGDQLVPHHLFHATDWYVKRAERAADSEKDAYQEEELAWIRDIPHAVEINRAFAVANIDYGRIDYSMVDGRLQTYEINTNPTPPAISRSRKSAKKPERRHLIRSRILQAFHAIDTPFEGPSSTAFDLPAPRMQKFQRLPLRVQLGELYERLRIATGI